MDGRPRALRSTAPPVTDGGPPERADVWTTAYRRPPLGRDLLRQQLMALLDGDERLVTVVGEGGNGKSHLVASLVGQVGGRTGRRVVTVDASDLGTSAQVAAAALDRLGGSAGGGAAWAQLLEALSCRPTLLVLDDVDQVADLGRALGRAIADAHDLVTVVTSRVPLGLPGEVVLDVPRFAPVGAASDDAIRSHPAAALFLREAALRGSIDRLDLGVVAEICDELDGHPLAIELAAARVNAVAPSALLAQLRTRGAVSLLRGRRSAGPTRHRSLATTVEWSFDLLTPRQQRALAALAARRGWWYEDDLLWLAGSVLDVPARALLTDVDDLVVHRFVDLDTGHPEHRVRVTRTTADLLAFLDRADLVDVRARANDALLSWLREWCREIVLPLPLGSRSDIALIERWAVEIDSFILAAHDAGDVQTACLLALGAVQRWDASGTSRSLLAALHSCAAAAADHGVEARRRAVLEGWSLYFRTARRSGPADEVTNGFDELVERVAASGDQPTLLAVVGCSICAAQRTQQYGRALPHCLLALESIRSSGVDEPLARFVLWQGMLEHQLGARERATEHALQALDLAREQDDDGLMSWSLLLLGQLTRGPGSVAGLERALELARTGGSPTQLAIVLAASAEALVSSGDLSASAARALEALEVASEVGDTSTIALTQLVLVAVAAAASRTREAAVLVGVIEPFLPLLAGAVAPGSAAAIVALLDRLRSALGDDEHDRLAAQGRAMTRAQSIAFASAVAQSCTSPAAADAREPLTEREWSVLVQLAGGRTNKEIAGALGIRSKTVTHHLSAVYRKLGLRNRSEAVGWAWQHPRSTDEHYT